MSHPVYLIAGEPFLVDEALAGVRAEVGSESLSEVSFDAGADVAEIKGALETPSLLGGPRLVVVEGADDLKKDQIDTLGAYIDDPAPHAVLVLVASGRSKLAAAVKKSGAVITLDAPRGRALAKWVRERAAAHDVKVDERAAWALIDAVGTELRDLDTALEQLSTGVGPSGKVGLPEIRRAFPRLADERVFALTDAVGERRLPLAMGALRRLLEQGDEPLMVFGALTSHVRRMLTARRAAERGPAALVDALGIPQWRAEKLHRQIRSYSEDELAWAMSVLAQTDVEMKGGDLPPEIALERAVVRIVTGTKA